MNLCRASRAAGRISLVVGVALLLFGGRAPAAPTRSSPLAVVPAAAGAATAFVVNPDSASVARIALDASQAGTLTHEAPVGRMPRTLAAGGTWVFTADQGSDDISRRDQADLGGLVQASLGTGCAPYGVAVTPDGQHVVATCEGTSEVVVLDLGLAIVARIPLAWPKARALAITADGATAFVTHFLTEEPGSDAHVSVVDLVSQSVARVFAVPADTTTCETPNSGQGVLNQLSAIALVPDGAPAAVAGQLWVGGVRENVVGKGLFERDGGFASVADARLFPFPFAPFPANANGRNPFQPQLHDVARSAIVKLDAATGARVGAIDLAGAGSVTDLELSADGATAAAVDVMSNAVYFLPTARGQGTDVATLFGSPAAYGPGGADPAHGCGGAGEVVPEGAFRSAPQARLAALASEPLLAADLLPVATGVDFDTPAFQASGTVRMRAVPDGVGTGPTGVRLSSDGTVAVVANYFARNLVAVGGPASTALRCSDAPGTSCGTDGDCSAGVCAPLVLAAPVATITGGVDADPLPPSLLDGKILFATVARDARLSGGGPAPAFDDARLPANRDVDGVVPGSVVSTARGGAAISCTTCHADLGGQDGRTWDFSQLGVSLRNTMDLRGRSAFAPGTCSDDPGASCLFDAACGAGAHCRAASGMVPPNVPEADRDRYFNPMLTIHWNGDRDEVEDFEHTFRALQGGGGCDLASPPNGCLGALVPRDASTSSTPSDVEADLGPPNRNLVMGGHAVGVRLTHLADFVYSLGDFVTNPNAPTEASERGRALFGDPQTRCLTCHNGPSRRQLFTDKRAALALADPNDPAAGDANNPFVRHDVGTANVFDNTDPAIVAAGNPDFAATGLPLPPSRDALAAYVTPLLTDLWNTAPYLHDGSAPTLLDVVRPCDPSVDECSRPGRGRNVNRQHGATESLTPSQLNDLAAFQKVIAPGTIVPDTNVLSLGALDLSTVALKPRGRTAKAPGHLAVGGVIFGAPGPIDPTAGLTLEVGTPHGEVMEVVTRTVPMRRNGRGFRGHRKTRGEIVTVTLAPRGTGRFRLSARVVGADLARLDTGNPDLTVAVEIQGTQFVHERNLVRRRGALRLP